MFPEFLKQSIRQIRRSPSATHLLFAIIAVTALLAEMFWLHTLVTTEYRLTDVMIRAHAAKRVADPDIVLIDIDDASMPAMQDIAGRWPWPRETHADLIEALSEFKPRAILFDVTFSERDTQRPKSDQRLSEVILREPHVYLSAARLDAQQDDKGIALASVAPAFGVRQSGAANATAALQMPTAVAPEAMRVGLVNSLVDNDGVMRRYRLRIDVQGWPLPSLPARIAADLGVALPQGNDFLLNWPQQSHARYSYGELYRLLTEKRASLNAEQLRAVAALFQNKIILVGASAAGLFDHHLTPLRSGLPGTEILALAVDNLKNGNPLRIAAPLWPLAFGLALITALMFAFRRRVNPLLIGGGLVLATLGGLGAAWVAMGRDVMLFMVTPLVFGWAWFLAAATDGYLRERIARERAVGMFGRFLNPNVVKQIVDQGETIETLSGRMREISVLFSDIRGFTTLSESRSPQEVVTLLNRYFSRQVEVVFRNGGTLDKFIGDCIMAFWGAPLNDEHHAVHAVGAALEMQDALLQFRAELQAELEACGSHGELDFDVGIGIHSGNAVVGFIGAQRKLDYTCIGDTVNLASRVEGLTKGIARVLVTRDTMLACMATDPCPFDFEPRGDFAVKGRTATVELFEPFRRRSS